MQFSQEGNNIWNFGEPAQRVIYWAPTHARSILTSIWQWTFGIDILKWINYDKYRFLTESRVAWS